MNQLSRLVSSHMISHVTGFLGNIKPKQLQCLEYVNKFQYYFIVWLIRILCGRKFLNLNWRLMNIVISMCACGHILEETKEKLWLDT